jgi:hypothetical protein
LIINVRGTHGSGKTTISHRLIDEHDSIPLVEPNPIEGVRRYGKRIGEPYDKNFKKPNAHRIPGANGEDVIMVGRYQSGCDGILPQEIIEDMLRYWAPRGHLVWENVFVSASVGRWGVLAHDLNAQGGHSVWAHLDTSAQMCLDRVASRREKAKAAGFKHRQEDTKHDVHMAHWRRCRRSACRAYQDSIDVRWIQHELAYEMVHDALVRAGWECPRHGLLLPEGPFLEPWTPTERELEYVLRTTNLPWEIETGHLTESVSKPTALELVPVGTIPSMVDPLSEPGDPFDL